MTQPTEPSKLSYSTDPPAWHRRRWVRPAIALALILLAASWAGPAITDRATAMYWQHRVDADVIPPGTRLVFMSAPTTLPDGGMRTNTTQAPIPTSWRNGVEDLQGRVPLKVSNILYVGGRTDSTGNRRLIVVCVAGSFDWSPTPGIILPAERELPLRAFSLIPGEWGKPPVQTAAHETDLIFPAPAVTFDIMAGRPTPEDQSRFSIEVRSAGGSVWIDGQLLADGTVVLARRDGRRSGRIHVW